MLGALLGRLCVVMLSFQVMAVGNVSVMMGLLVVPILVGGSCFFVMAGGMLVMRCGLLVMIGKRMFGH